jgi:hypothetical protein
MFHRITRKPKKTEWLSPWSCRCRIGNHQPDSCIDRVGDLISDDTLRVNISAPTNKNLPLSGRLCGGGNITAEVAMQAER